MYGCFCSLTHTITTNKYKLQTSRYLVRNIPTFSFGNFARIFLHALFNVKSPRDPSKRARYVSKFHSKCINISFYLCRRPLFSTLNVRKHSSRTRTVQTRRLETDVSGDARTSTRKYIADRKRRTGISVLRQPAGRCRVVMPQNTHSLRSPLPTRSLMRRRCRCTLWAEAGGDAGSNEDEKAGKRNPESATSRGRARGEKCSRHESKHRTEEETRRAVRETTPRPTLIGCFHTETTAPRQEMHRGDAVRARLGGVDRSVQVTCLRNARERDAYSICFIERLRAIVFYFQIKCPEYTEGNSA